MTKTNELPEDVATVLQKYIKLQSEILAFEHDLYAYKVGGQCELEAKADIRLFYMEKLRDEVRDELDSLIHIHGVSSEAIVKALS